MEEIKYSLNPREQDHPLEKANILSELFFCWLLPYFVKGYKKELTEDDMYGPLKTHESSRLGDKLEAAWIYQVKFKKVPSLLKALTKVFYLEFIIYGILYLVQEFVIKLSQPLLISKFLKYYEPNQKDITKQETYIYAGLIVLFALLNVLCIHGYYFRVMHLGMKIRVATCSLIYRKALKLNRTALRETTVGQMVNLLSNDVGRFDLAVQHIHSLWVAPIETLVVMCFLYVYVGPTGLTGACFLILFIVPQMYLGKKISQYRLNTAQRTDERVRLMSEIITGIQVIKMYTWEKPFAKLVEMSRMREMKQIGATSTIRAIMITCVSVLHRSSIYLCILTYVLAGNKINATYAYTVAAFYGILRQAVTMYLPRAVTQYAETCISVERIENFLLYEEISDGAKRISTQQKREHKDVGIHLKNVSVQWNTTLPEYTLESVTLDVNSNELIAVVGTVGGGKSTLLHSILKEVPPLQGIVDVQGTVSYASQEPWVFGGSIKQNIIFGQKFELSKYNQVVRVCALEKDFDLFPHGDQTLIADRGVTLSGGQKSRINLARAVYKEADIYLLDDPLSAVDTQVGKRLFEECICGYLKGKCVVLITNQLQYLKNVNTIYLMQNGKIQAKGSYVELKNSDDGFTKLLIDNKGDAEGDLNGNSTETKQEGVNGYSKKKKPVQEREQRSSGTISMDVYKSYLRAGGNWCKTVVMLFAFLVAQLFAVLTDYFITIWVNVEQRKLESNTGRHSPMNNTINDTFANETNSTTNIHSSDAHMKQSFLYVMDLILTEETSLLIYSILVFASIVLALSRSISFFRYCMKASTKLHNLMFNKIVRAPMRFFNANSSGRILNRFSKDIGTIDETLPLTAADTIQIAFILLSISIVIGCLNPWILIPTVIIVLIFYGLRLIFLATSRDIKRIEAVTRSPMFTHLSASIQGLTTIRAFGAQDILKKEFDHYQNKYVAASFLFLGANRTFGFWLDFHCVIYTALVLISILFIKSEIFGGNVGFALTEAVGLTGMFQWGIRQWSEMENQMTSVERIQEYIETTPELDENAKEPPNNWPKGGDIIFERVCLRYSPEDPYVLNDLSFEIKPKSKIGVVGRTGAGKSSLIAALFRLTDIDGNIFIDHINTKEVPLDILRSKISIIPQEPVLFSGTLRKNLDPFEEYEDNVLWNALEYVELRSVVNDLPFGLDCKISEGGFNFSVGQRQLICFARAIIRHNKILVLDEATANVDPYTDGLIQTTIREKFADCTVLTIAHRLHTIMDSDMVLVIDAGRVVEFDHPHALLLNPSGFFHKLVQQTGSAMAENLSLKAKEHYSQYLEKYS